jgi:hypothetical protein
LRIAPIFLLFGAALINCASLTPYAAAGCGNRVVELGEDCDDAANPQCKSCRLRCDVSLDAGAPLACPDGWGCGTDKICRQMTGVLKPATAAVSATVVTLKAGDFDADGRTDIIGSPPFGSAGSSRVHYFDGNAALSTVTALDVPIAIPIVRNLDDSPGDDIGFSVRNLSAGAFGALSGQPDRTFSTIVFPSATFPATDTRFIPVNAAPASGVRLPAGLPSCAIGLRSGTDPVEKAVTHTFASFCTATAAEANPGTLDGTADFTTSDVQGQPKHGRIFALDDANGNGSACGQIVFTTSDAVKIMSPCTPGTGNDQKVAWRTNASAVTVKLPGTLVEEIYVGPVDSFARDEIVVHVEKKRENDPKEAAFYKYDPLARDFVASSKFSAATGLPLAGGNLDGDDTPDFVLATGIKLSTPNPLTVSDATGYAVPEQVKDWTHEVPPRDQLRLSQARIGRFNSDDLPDVLVSFNNSLDVDLMSNSGGGRFVPFTVRSEQIVRGITSGDFDGDRIDDVAFFQSAAELGTADETTLRLAFGSAVGGPGAPRTAGKFKYARGFGPLRGVDGTDDLAVVQIAPNDGQPVTSISVLYGNGGRQPVAPLSMIDPAEPLRRWEPVSFNIGAFPGPGTQAIIAIATGFLSKDDPTGGSGKAFYDFHTEPWLSLPDSTLVGGLEPFTPIRQDLTAISGIDQAAALKGRRELRLITATGDIDVPKNGTDELVNMANVPEKNVVSVVVVHTQQNAPPDATVADIPDARVDEGDPIEVFDLDRDGFADIVYIITVGNRRTLSVLRGNGSGGFVSPPITTASTNIKDDAIGFAKLDSGTVTKVAVVTSNQLWLVDLGKDSQFHASNATTVLGSTTSGITAIAGGDINGDGVPDLAIAQAGGIRIIPQKPTTE